MNGVLYSLVLHWKNLDSKDDLIKEKLGKNVVAGTANPFLASETEVDAIFHNEKAPLTFVTLQTFHQIAVNLGKGPGRHVVFTTLSVHIL